MSTRHSSASSRPDMFTLVCGLLGSALWRLFCRRLAACRAWYFWRFAVRIPERARKKHTYVSGSSGSGKSELLKVLMFAQLRKRRPPTVILLDPDGDLAGQVEHWQQNRGGERCVIFDLGLKPGFTPVINPLQVADRSPENIDLMAQLFVSAFNEIMENSQLTLNMKVLLHPCVSVLMELGDASLPDLQRLLDDDRNTALLARAQRTHAFQKHRDFFAYEFPKSDYQPTKRAICKKIQSLLNYRAFYNLTVGPSTVDLRALMDSRKLVVFNLAQRQLGVEAMPAFGKFLVAIFHGLALRRPGGKERARVPTYLFLDECHHFLTPAIEEMLKESRKYAFYLTLAQQTVGDKMSPEFFKTVMTNTEVKITGANDPYSLDLMAHKTHTAPELLYRLVAGYFAVKVGKSLRPATFLLTFPTFLLEDRNALTPAEWQVLVARQVSLYYRPVPTEGEEPAVQLMPGADPAEFSEPETPATPAESWAFFPRRRQLPLAPKYPFFLQNRFLES